MRKLTNQELNKISGGGISWGLASLIAAGATFIIGVIDGYIRPLACNR